MIPDKLNIFGTVYKVRESDLGGSIDGLIDHNERTIYIHNKQSEQEKRITLYHEMVHGISYVLGFNQIIHPQTEELLAENMAMMIEECNEAMNKKSKRKKRATKKQP